MIRVGLLASVLALGCESSVDPLAGDQYELQSIADKTLPAPYTNDPAARILSDFIVLGSSGMGQRVTTYQSDGAPNKSERKDFTYIRTGDRIEINFPCPPNADCVPSPHFAGTLTSSSLTLSESRFTLVPLVYRRLIPID